jgi:hypothetical protein
MTIGIASFAIVAAFLDKLEKRRVYVAGALVILFLSICLSFIAMFLAVREVPTRGKNHRRLLLTVDASIFAYIIALLWLMIIALISIGRD